MENQSFEHSVAAFEIPKDGFPIFEIGNFEFLWNAEKTHIAVAELSQDLYFELSAESTSIEAAQQQGIFSPVNDTGEITFKFPLKNIFHNYVPTGTTIFLDGKTAEWQYMVLEGTDYGLEFSGNVTCENGWVGVNGYLKAAYEENPVFKVKIYQKINTADLKWEDYHFNSLEEAATANPDTVRHLTIINPDFKDIPEQIFSFINLETLSLLRLNAPPLDEQAPKLPLSAIDERIARLSKLKWLQVNNARLTTLPESLGQLKDIEYLGFIRCKLSALPYGAWKLPNLKTLHLQENRISKIPDDVRLSNLTELEVSGNPLDTLPAALLNTTKLERIIAYDCHFSSLPEAFGNFIGLEMAFETKKKLLDYRYKNPDGTPPTQWDDRIYYAEQPPVFFEQLLKNHGLEQYSQTFRPIIKKSIGFRITDDGASHIGAHRFGGRPDLPADVPYPTFFYSDEQKSYYYEFLAQINCEAVAHLQEYLPRTGILFFFLSTMHDLGTDTDYPVGKVIYVEDLSHLSSGNRFNLKEDDFFEHPDGQYRAGTAAAFEKFSFPSLYNIETNAFQFKKKAPAVLADPDFFSEQYEFEEAFDSEATYDHGINTHVFTQHENPELQAAMEKKGNPEEWMVLLQLKSRGEFQWGDAGDLFFVIHKSDLAQKHFNNIYVGIESS